jgi:hypothetical protein
MSRQDIEAAFPDWTVVGEEAADVMGAPGPEKWAHPHFCSFVTRLIRAMSRRCL